MTYVFIKRIHVSGSSILLGGGGVHCRLVKGHGLYNIFSHIIGEGHAPHLAPALQEKTPLNVY